MPARPLEPEPPQMPERPTEPELPRMPERPVRPNLPELPQPLMGKLQSAWATGAGVAVLITLIIAEAPELVVLAGIVGIAALARFLYESWTYEKRKEKYERERAEKIWKHEEALRCWEAECKALEQAHQEKLNKYYEEVCLWQVRCEEIRRVHQQKYEEVLRRWEAECEALIQAYQERLREHQEDLRQWEAECEAIEREHRDQAMELIANQRVQYPDTVSDARCGRFDNFLRNALMRQLESLERDSFKVTLLPERSAVSIEQSSVRCYTPDIAMQVSRDGKRSLVLLIDIEIDEPWFLEGNLCRPAHTVNDPKQSKRDAYLADRGWVVVRFSERQVYEESEKCINLIFCLVSGVLGALDSKQPDLSFSFPTDHKRWGDQSALSEPRFPPSYF
ncbi:hypothetical protein [Synechococcus sp. W60.1]|uniref:hypothetical protein n=1 Tax=Synechococcus sp. W60.1 TaxID=2964516 RepID=UPI0039C0C44C